VVPELYDALRQAGVDETMARRAAAAVFGARDGADLLTKADFRTGVADVVTKVEFRAEMSALHADMSALRADLVTKTELRTEMGALRSDIHAEIADLRSELLKWNLGAIAVATAIFAAIVRLG
jgi:hypothetical protein